MAKYKIKLTLKRPMLGTNPADANVHDQHIIEKQRKLITENSKLNKELNKYLDQIQISDEKKETELNAIIARLEQNMGYALTPDQREVFIAGKLESLKETAAELDTKGVTVFFRNEDGKSCIGDHMIYGFMKAASEAICKTQKERKNSTVLSSMAFTNSIINMHVRCEQMLIPFDKDVVRENGSGRPRFNQRSLRAMTAQGPRVSLAKSEEIPAGASLEFVLNVMPGSPLETKHIKQIFEVGSGYFGLGQWRNAGYGMFDAKVEEI